MMTAASVRAARRRAVPILMYHQIQPPPHTTFGYLYVSRQMFRKQMRVLYARGYHAVTLRQLFDFWKRNKPIARKPIVITFDDGWRSVYAGAAPVLRKYRWPAVVNVVVSALDTNYGLSSHMVRTLIKRGWEIDCHTIDHPELTRLSWPSLAVQIGGARQMLRRRFHVPVDFFCYPGGSYNATVIQAVRSAGFTAALGIRHGFAHWPQRWAFDRVPIRDWGMPISGFLLALRPWWWDGTHIELPAPATDPLPLPLPSPSAGLAPAAAWDPQLPLRDTLVSPDRGS
jgi:peptidoglycan/xylan/chitin deacetylase (PgdA/CDA1 family)